MMSSEINFPVVLRNLLANPFNCNCHLAWLGDWLRKKRIVTGNPRCQKPYFLKEIPIQDVAIQDFTCDDGKEINIWTFYNFSFHIDSCMTPIDPKVLHFKGLHTQFLCQFKNFPPIFGWSASTGSCTYAFKSFSCLCSVL